MTPQRSKALKEKYAFLNWLLNKHIYVIKHYWSVLISKCGINQYFCIVSSGSVAILINNIRVWAIWELLNNIIYNKSINLDTMAFTATVGDDYNADIKLDPSISLS